VDGLEVDADGDGLLSEYESENDFAILGFDESFGYETGWFGLDPNANSGYYWITGYPAVYADQSGPRMTEDFGYAELGTTANTWHHSSIEVNSGNSGGPIWHYLDGGYYAVGVVSTGVFSGDIYGHFETIVNWIDGNNWLVSSSSTGAVQTGTDAVDVMSGMNGDDIISGLGGSDTLSGGDGDDLIYGNQDADRIVGGTGMDTLFGGQQSDIVFGLTGADQVYGNKQNDTLYGGVGDDSMFGGQNDDLVFGEIGNDRVDGNRGNDTLFGGDGADRFVISKGNDVVQDFSVAEDRIETLDAFSAINQAVINGSLVLTDTDGDTLTLIGISSTLTEEYFI
jgi:Ca2+-binding RTX toxin-like protein